MRAAPRATYRVQLRREFDFASARDIVPYLADLGVSHLYCSPYMQAAAGSAHGYDVVDPTAVSDELGGDQGLAGLDAALAERGMGQLLDIVPNHMCITDPRDRFWWDVLRFGRDSVYAHFFDVDWDAPGLDGRVLLPVLDDELDAVLQRRELHVARGSARMELRYHEQRFPLAGADDSSVGDDATAELLQRQHYRLEHWRSGLSRLNYRRFFDVSSLAGVRVEDESVFTTTHQRALDLVREGVVDGLRVDHIDGLREPSAYIERLRHAVPDAWLVVEKILAAGKDLPRAWQVDGTTGYDFAGLVTSLIIDAAGLQSVGDCYEEFTGDEDGFAAHARRGRRDVLDGLLTAERDRLIRAGAAAGIGEAGCELRELIVGLTVYRVYPRGWDPLSPPDQAALAVAETSARAAGCCDPAKLDALLDVLRGHGEDTCARRDLRARFQQLSSAVAAKGVEDTAFYRSVSLVALNEVGCEPTRLSTVDDFHAACRATAEWYPRTLLATATHDTKRGEDARIRVAMLSEMSAMWRDSVWRWRDLAERHRRGSAPSRSAEYLLYQTLVAAHPIGADRAAAYMMKAAREAKAETSWLDPDPAYEGALDAFVRGVVGDAAIGAGVERLVRFMTPAWQTSSLSQVLLKLTAPGVPDLYQGCELWDLRLVDPDNRTPVDYQLRHRLLLELDGMTTADIRRRGGDGLPKLHVIRSALRLRARRPQTFGPQSWYEPLLAHGSRVTHVVSFARGAERDEPDVAVLAVRLAHGLQGDWGDTTLVLPPGMWHNVLTGARVNGGEQLLAYLTLEFPVALLERAA